ncbi:neutral zinc metallopeptidase [Modestobacter sp. SYSU DS0511]
MPISSRRLAGLALAATLGTTALSGCAVTFIEGSATPLVDVRGDVDPEEFPIIGAVDSDVDRLARNALADLNTWWADQFGPVYQQQFPPLTGGYYSVDPADIDPTAYPGGEIGCGEPPEAVEDNAFYCGPSQQYPNGDAIQYDRAFLGELAFGTGGSEGYGRFIPALVMAHEFGHAVQGRVGYPVQASIAIETQADCFAGAWTRWVADGEAPHNSIRPAELDDVLRGYLLLRDPVGTGLDAGEAHGSYFDRVSAFQQGFDDGPTACRDAFGPDRPYTQREFSDQDLLTGGDAPYADVQSLIATSFPEFWTAVLDSRGEEFRAPELQPFTRTAPGCAGSRPEGDLVYCPAEGTVAFDEADLTRPLYDDLGDYAVLTAVAVPYGLAVRDQLGLSTDDQEAVRSSVCLAGAFTAAALEEEVPSIRISPGDADESVSFLLEYSDDPEVIADVGLTGFQLVDVFRAGVFEGPTACGLGS